MLRSCNSIGFIIGFVNHAHTHFRIFTVIIVVYFFSPSLYSILLRVDVAEAISFQSKSIFEVRFLDSPLSQLSPNDLEQKQIVYTKMKMDFDWIKRKEKHIKNLSDSFIVHCWKQELRENMRINCSICTCVCGVWLNKPHCKPSNISCVMIVDSLPISCLAIMIFSIQFNVMIFYRCTTLLLFVTGALFVT